MDRDVMAVAALAALLATTGVQAQPLGETFATVERRGPEIAFGMEEARSLFACKTRVSFTQGHGTQVSYTHLDGTNFLWYPVNTIILPGKWRLEPRAAPAQPSKERTNICFSYPSDS